MGVHISWGGDVVTADGAELQGIAIDAGDVPDLVPILAVLAHTLKALPTSQTSLTCATRRRIDWSP